MWVEFVAGCLLCSERFFSRYSGFPLSSKINISNSSSTRDRVDCVDVLPLNHNLFIIFLFHVHDVTFFFTSGNSTGVLSSSPSSVSACGLCISPQNLAVQLQSHNIKLFRISYPHPAPSPLPSLSTTVLDKCCFILLGKEQQKQTTLLTQCIQQSGCSGKKGLRTLISNDQQEPRFPCHPISNWSKSSRSYLVSAKSRQSY